MNFDELEAELSRLEAEKRQSVSVPAAGAVEGPIAPPPVAPVPCARPHTAYDRAELEFRSLQRLYDSEQARLRHEDPQAQWKMLMSRAGRWSASDTQEDPTMTTPTAPAPAHWQAQPDGSMTLDVDDIRATVYTQQGQSWYIFYGPGVSVASSTYATQREALEGAVAALRTLRSQRQVSVPWQQRRDGTLVVVLGEWTLSLIGDGTQHSYLIRCPMLAADVVGPTFPTQIEASIAGEKELHRLRAGEEV